MPSKRSFRYLSVQKDRKRRSLAAVQKILSFQIPSGGLVVNWIYQEPLSYSERQWELFTSALCQEGALESDRSPGPIIHDHPTLTIEIQRLASFEKFRKFALMNVAKHDFQISFVSTSSLCTSCLIQTARGFSG